MRRRGLPEEDCGAASGVATKTVSPGKARARLLSVASKASWDRGTRLTRRPLVPLADEGVRSTLVCVVAIGRSLPSLLRFAAQSLCLFAHTNDGEEHLTYFEAAHKQMHASVYAVAGK